MVLVARLGGDGVLARFLLGSREMSQRMPTHMNVMRNRPPTNSASVNCQPRKIQSTIPISKTRFVEAN
jgi:hypothetical protein